MVTTNIGVHDGADTSFTDVWLCLNMDRSKMSSSDKITIDDGPNIRLVVTELDFLTTPTMPLDI